MYCFKKLRIVACNGYEITADSVRVVALLSLYIWNIPANVHGKCTVGFVTVYAHISGIEKRLVNGNVYLPNNWCVYACLEYILGIPITHWGCIHWIRKGILNNPYKNVNNRLILKSCTSFRNGLLLGATHEAKYFNTLHLQIIQHAATELQCLQFTLELLKWKVWVSENS